MFATVKHEQGELKINPNCYIRIIYDYIKEQLSIPEDREIDLVSEDGNPCLIYQLPPNTDGTTVLRPRHTYTLLTLGGSTGEGEVAEEIAEEIEDGGVAEDNPNEEVLEDFAGQGA